MRTFLAYILVIPLSFIASRLGGLVAGFPIAILFSSASVELRSTIGGFIGGVFYSITAAAFGWFVFNWLVGKGSFTLFPFLASVLILIVTIPGNYNKAKADSQLKEKLENKGIAEEMGNAWSLFAGEICGLILAGLLFIQ